MGPVAPPPAPSAKTLSCAACGAPVTVRAAGHSVVVVCGACQTALDPEHPDREIIARYQTKLRVQPPIPLGTRGKLKGEPFEAIGFMVRESRVDGETFSWTETLLFNPFTGFLWLAEYQGHWTLSKAASGYPKTATGETVEYLGHAYRHFQTARARVSYVVGEFPWRVSVGETATLDDYVDPPRLLSREKTKDETTWSVGDYVPGDQVWAAFGLTGSPPARAGVGAAQPSPYAPHRRTVVGLLGGFLAGAVLLHLLFVLVSGNQVVYEGQFSPQFARTPTGVTAPAVVTPVFELTGRRSNAVVEINTAVSNNWAYFNLALINEETGDALNFGREISYYSGYDSDGSWSEGSPGDRVYLPGIPRGRYYLLIEPEAGGPVSYTLRVRRDVPRTGYLLVALGLLLVPPAFFFYRDIRFEHQRWSESDHPMFPTGDGDDDDD